VDIKFRAAAALNKLCTSLVTQETPVAECDCFDCSQSDDRLKLQKANRIYRARNDDGKNSIDTVSRGLPEFRSLGPLGISPLWSLSGLVTAPIEKLFWKLRSAISEEGDARK
jgi:hypothetical protein